MIEGIAKKYTGHDGDPASDMRASEGSAAPTRYTQLPDSRYALIKGRMGMDGKRHLQRVRKICLALPGATEKLSHGEPKFFVKKRVFAMFSNNHHRDGHIAVLIPGQPGEQEALIASCPAVYYRPPYVGIKGWVGIDLDQIGDDDLGAQLTEAWQLITSRPCK